MPPFVFFSLFVGISVAGFALGSASAQQEIDIPATAKFINGTGQMPSYGEGASGECGAGKVVNKIMKRKV